MERKLEAALDYLQLGWVVIPLCWPDELGNCGCGGNHPPAAAGKAPLLKNWPEVEVTEETIRKWWTQWPEANIGVVLDRSGLLVVDADSDEAVAEAQELGADCTAQVTSGRGRHFYFEAEELPTARAVHVGESRELDLLTAGYAVLPPSLHRLGSEYQWTKGTSYDLAPAPEWVTEWLEEAQSKQVEPLELTSELPAVRLDDLTVSDWLKRVIVQGLPAAVERYESRSEAIFGVMRSLLQSGHNIETIAAVLLNQEWAIGDKLREKADPVRAVCYELARCLAKGREEGESFALQDAILSGPELVDLLKNDDMEWLVEDLLPVGVLGVLGGPAKGGKSTLAMHLMKAITQQQEFLGHQGCGSPVLYVNYEMAPRIIVEMFADIYGLQPVEWPPTVVRPSVPLDPAQLHRYIRAMNSDQRGLVVVDTARGAFRLQGEEENWVGELGRRFRELGDVAHDLGWTVLVIHHTKKKGGGQRTPTLEDLSGTGDVAAAVDVSWIWQPEELITQPGQLLLDGRVHKRAIYHVRLFRELCERVVAQEEKGRG